MAATASTEPVFYNPFEPGYAEDPYRQFALLREHDPVHESLAGPWMLFRYEDVNRLLRDASLSVEEDRSTRVGPRAEVFERLLAQSEQGDDFSGVVEDH